MVPDGTRIAFVSLRAGNEEIYVMHADGSNVVRLTQHPSIDTEPAWSPDGTKIAFTAWHATPSGADSNVYVLRVDGTNPGPGGPAPGRICG